MGGSQLTRWQVPHYEASTTGSSFTSCSHFMAQPPALELSGELWSSHQQLPAGKAPVQAFLLQFSRSMDTDLGSPLAPLCLLSFLAQSQVDMFPGFLHMQALHSGSYPTPLGHQIMQRAGKEDAQVPQLGSTGTKRLCRSEVASFQMPSKYRHRNFSVAMWGCAPEALTPSAYLLTENNSCSKALCQLHFLFLNLYLWRSSFLID